MSDVDKIRHYYLFPDCKEYELKPSTHEEDKPFDIHVVEVVPILNVVDELIEICNIDTSDSRCPTYEDVTDQYIYAVDKIRKVCEKFKNRLDKL